MNGYFSKTDKIKYLQKPKNGFRRKFKSNIDFGWNMCRSVLPPTDRWLYVVLKWNSQIIFLKKNKFNFHYPALVVVLSHSSLHPVVFFYSLHAMQYPNKIQRPAIQWIGFRSKSQKIYISSNLHIVHYCCLRACLCNVKCMCIGAVNAIELAWTENRMHQFMFWQS